eukprot:CAMPEP_0174384756 /NCGR_PEP_ID=MMETSP0811_2-20130205/126130_1 /TAXON_ID=73025 ORGANISM="Eutreptiella gymnastica-like, Strain CCMP1594" /NCGR_SAMPLE_ID=MMETSP0811_2 /ASSEMBLY_ACC=CAM_ASM_000667 /LENGTH=65 /DNA_ID=CAMNT_0015538817 /DNA_START=1199 /DNA_END=1396 /DNA_ORIENTATION=+
MTATPKVGQWDGGTLYPLNHNPKAVLLQSESNAAAVPKTVLPITKAACANCQSFGRQCGMLVLDK